MSYLAQQDSPCTYCQYPNSVEVWSIINVNTDPELRDLLLGGELNMAVCASCKEFFYAEHFLIYHDPAYELMAFVYPHDFGKEKSKWEQKTLEDFAKTQESLPEGEKQKYLPLTLFGLDQLVFFVEDEEEALIQGDIVALLAADHGFQVHRLRPSLAREKKMPLVVPYIGGQNGIDQTSVLPALEKLKAINDRLFVYSKFEESLKQNPSWKLDLVTA